jgi:hypothetical protein
MFVIVNTETHKYVARRGSEHSYTTRLENAETFRTRDAAEKDRCPGNEIVVDVNDLLQTPQH